MFIERLAVNPVESGRSLAVFEKLNCSHAIAPDGLKQVKCPGRRRPETTPYPLADDIAVRKEIFEVVRHAGSPQRRVVWREWQ
jgi:hypothetical protein